MDTNQKLAVSLREAAAMLSISSRMIQHFIAVDRIPARKVGKRILILVRDLEEFLRVDQPTPILKREGSKRLSAQRRSPSFDEGPGERP